MVFIPAGIGAILLIAALSMSRQSFFGKDCFYYGELTARTFCYNPGVFYGLIVVGLALLAVSAFLFVKAQMEADRSRSGYMPVGMPPSRQPEAQPVIASAVGNPAWKTLKEFDADIQAAVAQLQGFGVEAEERLATAYLAVNDKGLLPSIITKIIAEEEKNAVEREEEKAKRAAAMSEREKHVLADREMKAEHTIGLIKAAGMVYDGRKVVSAEMYYGAAVGDQGWAKIVYADGRAELRAGSSWMTVNT